MNRFVFTRIVRDLSAKCLIFKKECDAVGKLTSLLIVKCTSANSPNSIRCCFRFPRRIFKSSVFAKATQTDVVNLTLFREQTWVSWGDPGSEPFILLEAVASQDLWIWHAFFGVPGSNNDVNVLRQSPVLNDLKVGKAPEVPFVANYVTYKWGYYLTDEIYPEWAVLMKSISQPGSNDVKRIRYKQAHEAARKDVERAFDVLKKKMGYRKNSCAI
ncbi:ALP1-like protein isoform X1 [Tanacetum coccineum]